MLGYDLVQNTVWAVSSRTRRLRSIGLAGSAAALDSKIDVFIGETKVGELYNSSTGAVNRDDMFRAGQTIPGGQTIHAFVTDAPATNPLNFAADIEG